MFNPNHYSWMENATCYHMLSMFRSPQWSGGPINFEVPQKADVMIGLVSGC